MEVCYKLNMNDLVTFQKDTVNTLPYFLKRKRLLGLFVAIIYPRLFTVPPQTLKKLYQIN